MIFTRELFERGKSSNGGYNDAQIKVLGVNNKIKGWAKALIGMDISEAAVKEFLELKDAHFKKRFAEGKPLKNKVAAKMGLLSFVPVFERLDFSQQYTHPNWQKMRLFVLHRDKYTCVSCKNQQKTLHAHHLKYLPNKYVWEVPHWYIVTLCEDCHSKEHGRDLRTNK